MIHRRGNREREAALWACGATLVGIPLMVMALALMMPNEPTSEAEPMAPEHAQVVEYASGAAFDCGPASQS